MIAKQVFRMTLVGVLLCAPRGVQALTESVANANLRSVAGEEAMVLNWHDAGGFPVNVAIVGDRAFLEARGLSLYLPTDDVNGLLAIVDLPPPQLFRASWFDKDGVKHEVETRKKTGETLVATLKRHKEGIALLKGAFPPVNPPPSGG